MTNFYKLNKITTKFITSAGALALIAGLNLSMAPQAYAYDCLLDTNLDGNADSNIDTDGGADSGGSTTRLACGPGASAGGTFSTALGRLASAGAPGSTAVADNASAAGGFSTALGGSASAAGFNSTALGYSASAVGVSSVALGLSANVAGDDSIVIGADAGDGGFAGTIVMGKDTLATEADQVILKSAHTFTILGNGDVGMGTAAPMGNLDIDSGVDDTTLLLSNKDNQWELKNKASTGRLNFKNLTAGGVPFKLGPNAVNGLLSVGTSAADLVEVRGELMVEGNVDVTGTLTTGGPTCGGGCDAVFDADYDLPSIEEHARAMFANSYLPQVGPTVPHAPMNISETVGDMLNELEKAHIYIADLNKDKQAMQTIIANQNLRITMQEARLDRMEQRLSD